MSSLGNAIERKIINVTGKRQVTIPLKFYEKLRFGKEVECFLTDDAIVIRPLSTSDDNFTMEILKDLVAQGYSGDVLIEKFAEQRSKIKKAIDVLNMK
ncbi:MAG: AbrB/MazE/SpoVT family DNA-binding domain-containing protein [Lachnospiraceae bacterium]|nr:AbrB/MazE/SpoVT family DNA-binding domain-containing protein [Lachnospiraceae bacterium]